MTPTARKIESLRAERKKLQARQWSILDDIRQIGELLDRLEGNWGQEADSAGIAYYLRQRANEIHPASNPAQKAGGR